MGPPARLPPPAFISAFSGVPRRHGQQGRIGAVIGNAGTARPVPVPVPTTALLGLIGGVRARGNLRLSKGVAVVAVVRAFFADLDMGIDGGGDTEEEEEQEEEEEVGAGLGLGGGGGRGRGGRRGRGREGEPVEDTRERQDGR
jgi:hypothetical protein